MPSSVGKYTNKIHFIKKKILEEVTKKQYAQVFMRPMDKRHGNYNKLIKKPMDLGTVITGVQNLFYRNADEVIADLRLVYQNWFALQTGSTTLSRPGNQLQKFVENKLMQMPDGPEFELNKDSRMTARSLSEFPWLQLNGPQEMTSLSTFIPIKTEPGTVKREQPVTVKRETVTVKRETVTVKRETVTVKREPVNVKREPVTVKVKPLTVKRETVTVKREPVTVKREPVTVKVKPVTVKVKPGPLDEWAEDDIFDQMDSPTSSTSTETIDSRCLSDQPEPETIDISMPMDDPITSRTETKPKEEEDNPSLRIITKILGKAQLEDYLKVSEQPIDDDDDPEDMAGTADFSNNCKMWDKGVDDLTSCELHIVMHIVVQHNMPATIKNGKVEFCITKFSRQVVSLIREGLFLARRSYQAHVPQVMTSDDQKRLTENLQAQLGEITAKLSSNRTGIKRAHTNTNTNTINTIKSKQLEPFGPAAMAKMASLSDEEDDVVEIIEKPEKKKRRKHHKRSKK